MNIKGILTLALIAVLMLAGCGGGTSGSSTTQPKDTSPTVTQSWHTVTNLTGSEGRNTDTFSIKGSKWRFSWSATVEQDEWTTGGSIYIFAYPEGKAEGEYVAVVTAPEITTSKSDTSYVYEGPGVYYFNIMAASLASWTITVEGYY